MRSLCLAMLSVVFLQSSVVQAGKVLNCRPQPVCRTAPATVQCRTILPYHIALQRADVADQLEVLAEQQNSEIAALKAELLAVKQERDSFLKQAEQEKALARKARQKSEQVLVQLKHALTESQEAQKVAESERVKTLNELDKTTKKLEQTQKSIVLNKEALAIQKKLALKMKEDRDVALVQVEELKATLAEMQTKLDESEEEAPQKAPKPGDTPPAKTEEHVKIEDEAESDQ